MPRRQTPLVTPTASKVVPYRTTAPKERLRCRKKKKECSSGDCTEKVVNCLLCGELNDLSLMYPACARTEVSVLVFCQCHYCSHASFVCLYVAGPPFSTRSRKMVDVLPDCPSTVFAALLENRPVIIRGAVTEWRAWSEWRDQRGEFAAERFLATFGGSSVPVVETASAGAAAYGEEARTTALLCDVMACGSSGEACWKRAVYVKVRSVSGPARLHCSPAPSLFSLLYTGLARPTRSPRCVMVHGTAVLSGRLAQLVVGSQVAQWCAVRRLPIRVPRAARQQHAAAPRRAVVQLMVRQHLWEEALGALSAVRDREAEGCPWRRVGVRCAHAVWCGCVRLFHERQPLPSCAQRCRGVAAPESVSQRLRGGAAGGRAGARRRAVCAQWLAPPSPQPQRRRALREPKLV